MTINLVTTAQAQNSEQAASPHSSSNEVHQVTSAGGRSGSNTHRSTSSQRSGNSEKDKREREAQASQAFAKNPGSSDQKSESDEKRENWIIEAYARYDFSARSDRELSFRKGDLLLLINRLSSDWWLGQHPADIIDDQGDGIYTANLRGKPLLVPHDYIRISTTCHYLDSTGQSTGSQSAQSQSQMNLNLSKNSSQYNSNNNTNNNNNVFLNSNEEKNLGSNHSTIDHSLGGGSNHNSSVGLINMLVTSNESSIDRLSSSRKRQSSSGVVGLQGKPATITENEIAASPTDLGETHECSLQMAPVASNGLNPESNFTRGNIVYRSARLPVSSDPRGTSSLGSHSHMVSPVAETVGIKSSQSGNLTDSNLGSKVKKRTKSPGKKGKVKEKEEDSVVWG